MSKEIVIIMGYNAAGKSTLVDSFLARGYMRLNRDLIGKGLDDLAKEAEVVLKNSSFSLVLDNTYPSVKSRASIIRAAKANKVPIRCVHLTTSFEDAQLNACLRMVRKTGEILQPEDFKKINDPNLFPPVALFHYRKEFQKPSLAEGFSQILNEPFVRNWGDNYTRKALLVDFDGTLRLSTGKQLYPTKPSEIKIMPGRTEKLKEYKNNGYILLGVSNQSGVGKGYISMEDTIKCFDETIRLLGVNIDYQFCPHRIPPVSCFCRKPHPAMGAFFIEKYHLNPSQCIMVGDMTTDETFAGRCGFQYVDANVFFKQ